MRCGLSPSVLENHSLTQAFALLRDPALNFLEGAPREERAEFRRTVVSLVLATDMAKHFEVLSAWKAHLLSQALGGVDAEQARSPTAAAGRRAGPVAGAAPSGAPAQPLTPDERRLYLMSALKRAPLRALEGELLNGSAARRAQFADLSNAARPRALHVEWCRRVNDEFWSQGDEERRLRLPVSPVCDRSTANVPESTAGFLNFLAIPLMQAWASRFPGARPLAQTAEENLAYWEAQPRPPKAP
eukprot:tig00020562_g11176.t1